MDEVTQWEIIASTERISEAHQPPVLVADPKGRVKRRYAYQEVMTPYDGLKSLPAVENYLRAGMTLEKLDAIARRMSDNEFAERMAKARSDLFEQIAKFDRAGMPKLNPVAYPHIHAIHKERKNSKKKERLATAPSGSFFD